MKQTEVKALLADPDVLRWHQNLKEGSDRTADDYLSWLAEYCSFCSKGPNELIEEFQRDKKMAQDTLHDYIASLKERKSRVDGKPLKPKTVNIALSAIKNWFKYREAPITRQIKVGNVRTTPTIIDEHSPSTEELNRILDHGDPRARATIALIAYLGIRPQAISLLKVGDFPELGVADGRSRTTRIPTIVRVRAELSKNKRPYFTFLVKRGVEYLVVYLDERLASGETLTDESPVIAVSTTTSTKGQLKEKGDSMGRKAISAIIRRAMRPSRTTVSRFRPYVLRSYYDWALQDARLPHIWEQFFMGHSGEIEAEYSVRKRLRDEQVEEMRSTFANNVEPKLVGSAGSQDIKLLRSLVKARVLDIYNPQHQDTLADALGIPVGTDDLRRSILRQLGLPTSESLQFVNEKA